MYMFSVMIGSSCRFSAFVESSLMPLSSMKRDTLA